MILWTCREGEVLEQALQFCNEQGIHFDGVNENIQRKYDDDPRKLSADFYIDDKCPMPIEEQWHAVDSMLGVTRKKVTNPVVIAEPTQVLRSIRATRR